MSNEVVLHTEKHRPFAERLRQEAARRRLLLAAPFIKRKALECLLADVPIFGRGDHRLHPLER